MKHWQFLLVLCLVLIFVVASCGRNAGEPGYPGQPDDIPAAVDDNGNDDQDQPAARQGVPMPEAGSTIRAAFIGGWWEDPALFDFVFDNFRERYPQFNLERVGHISTSVQLLTHIQAGDQPDFWLGTDTQWAQYSTSTFERLMMPLNDFLERDLYVNFDTMDRQIMDMFRFLDGNYYGLPHATAHWALFWNRDMFARAGLPNRAPETWNEMLDFAQRLIVLNTDGLATQVGFSVDGTEGPFTFQMLPTMGLSQTDRYGLWADLTNPAVEATHRFTSEFYQLIDGIRIPGFLYRLHLGTAGMAIGNLSQLSTIAESGIDFGIAPIPHPNEGGLDHHVLPSLIWQFGGIPYGARNPEGGWLFMKYVVTEVAFNLARNDMLRAPGTSLPAFAAHIPTRERIETLFFSQADERTANIMRERNELMENLPFFMEPGSPLSYEMSNISHAWGIRRHQEGMSLSDFLRGIETEYNSVLQTWMRGLEAQGWQFPRGQTPIPPS